MNTTTAPPEGPPDLLTYREVLKHEYAALSRDHRITVANGKAPIGKGWQHHQLTIGEAERSIDSTSHPAIGLQLGPGGAIDFDVDGPDEKVAFCWLFEDDPIVMPAYTSGRVGGEHYLAAFHPRLAAISKATVKVICPTGESIPDRLGAGGKGAHSVLPPSYHCRQGDDGQWEWTGAEYRWKPHLTLEDVGLPMLPDSVVEKLLAAAGPAHHEAKDKAPADGTYGPGNRHDHLCSLAAKVRNAGAHFETILAAVAAENQTRCNPPKSDYEVRHIAEYYASAESTAPPPPKAGDRIERVSFAELAAAHPSLHPPVIDGLLRQGETMNLISSSKVGKSWLLYHILLSVVTGRHLFDRYVTRQGKALLVDNELHPSTLANRIPTVGEAMHLDRENWDLDLEVWPLRGRLKPLSALMADFDRIEPGEFAVIALDAKYRFGDPSKSENDNGAETQFYNMIDGLAERTKSAILLVHHGSKGSQGDKRVTDVGAGAGAQSRAADCHLVLREHEDDNAVVMEAAVRSFKPVEPLVLRWMFPLWLPDMSADPRKLKGLKTQQERQQDSRDREGMEQICDALTGGEATSKKLQQRTGISRERANRLLAKLIASGVVDVRTEVIDHNECDVYSLKEGGWEV